MSAVVWAAIALVVIVACMVEVPVWLISLVVDPRRRLIQPISLAAARLIVRLNPFWRVRVLGPRRLPAGRFVICSNHQSNADVFCLAFLRGQSRYVAKRSLFRVPFLGWMLHMSGHVPIDRGERSSAEAALVRCRAWLERGLSVSFFPEGTRSETGELREFKMGAFKLAVDAGVPILPIALTGTSAALPKHGWIMREKSDVRIRVLEPIPPGQDPEHLRDRTREIIARAKAELESASPAA